MTATPKRRRSSSPLFQTVGPLLVALLSAASWYAWLGWDDEYRVDPVTGAVSGPYAVWQVLGCALTLLAVFVAALLVGVRPVPAGAALTLAFSAAAAVTWARRDDSGLYVIGVGLLLVGLAAGTAVVSVLVRALRRTSAVDAR
ncbi:hypothetical protein [Micromonospora sp. URMC 103]|uniref:hypothetical protein n=1 Tax=Micromonospora sp. URMC 103 TaxID=3423406 RepID=UPI003F1C4950